MSAIYSEYVESKADKNRDLREALERDGASPETHKQLANLIERNLLLQQQLDQAGSSVSQPKTAASEDPADVQEASHHGHHYHPYDIP